MDKLKWQSRFHKIIQCRYCNKEFLRTSPSAKYCSRKCFRSHHYTPIGKIKLNCKYCNKEFERTASAQKFCSTRCSELSVGRLIEHPIRNCVICGKEYQMKTRNQKYCSYGCKSEKHNKRRLKGKYATLLQLRHKIRKCEVCGFSLFEALESHHYNKTEGIVLCGSCHNIWHRISEQKYSDKGVLIKIVRDKIFEHQCNLEHKAKHGVLV